MKERETGSLAAWADKSTMSNAEVLNALEALDRIREHM